ncbi:aspartate/glutamate racemase family protein [Corallincola spongiicola]|uniref:Aspartate/glutamate racemase family protein n=1 Tax=Corallincola spongiicola TaxID=2520508 RepID=A0ABY1WQJ8_9GAMM|nr:aspartate/glutamate racemase family protein [Corallincola spongiicola]TAA46997.1 aspartate/glutamate racemase family protein [Corallincola spongiicola]
MKTIGLVGGMSWESTAIYYKSLNEEIYERLGGLNSASTLIYSFNFREIATLQEQGDWTAVGQKILHASQKLERAGAEGLLLCSNSIHKVAPQLENQLSIPVLNIIDITAVKAKQMGIKKIGLLGTRFTMEEPFYRERLELVHGIDVITPDQRTQRVIHDIIFKELCHGEIRDASEAELLLTIDALEQQGAQAILLGCTELAMLMREQTHHIPLLDSTLLHVEYAMQWMLNP